MGCRGRGGGGDPPYACIRMGFMACACLGGLQEGSCGGTHGASMGGLHGVPYGDMSRGHGGLHRGLLGCRHRVSMGLCMGVRTRVRMGKHNMHMPNRTGSQASDSTQINVEVMYEGMHSCEFGSSGVCKDHLTDHEPVAVDVL